MDDQQAGMTVDRYAEVSAYLRHYPAALTDLVLAFFGLEPGQWDDASRKWSQVFDAEIAAGQGKHVVRFGETYTATRLALKSHAPELAAKGATKDGAVVETLEVTMSPDADMEDTLPFASDKHRSAPPPVVPSMPSPGRGETAEMPVLHIDLSASPMPFASPSRNDLRERCHLALYAMIVAELEAKRDERDVVLRRHDFDERLFTAIESAWAEELDSHPETKVEFQQLVRRFRGHP
jgi:hypothetical protein